MAEEKQGAKPDPTEEKNAPEPDLAGRIDGLRGWLEEIERRQNRMTYFGGAAGLIALIASGAALLTGISANNDSASKEQLDEVKAQVTQIQAGVAQAGATAKKIEAIGQQLTTIQQQIRSQQGKQSALSQEIATLRLRLAQVAAQPTPGKTGN